MKLCECNGVVLCYDSKPDKVEKYETKIQVLRAEVESMKQSPLFCFKFWGV